MRGLKRNQRNIYYAVFKGSTAIVDENGHETGEHTTAYGEPVLLRANISAAGGGEVADAFGGFTDYSRTITVMGQCEMDENSVVWFGIDPQTEPYNYIVTRKADSKNGILYGLQKVQVR